MKTQEITSALVTCDGVGKARKAEILAELLQRIAELEANQCDGEPVAWKHLKAFYFCTSKSESFHTVPLYRKAAR